MQQARFSIIIKRNTDVEFGYFKLVYKFNFRIINLFKLSIGCLYASIKLGSSASFTAFATSIFNSFLMQSFHSQKEVMSSIET